MDREPIVVIVGAGVVSMRVGTLAVALVPFLNYHYIQKGLGRFAPSQPFLSGEEEEKEVVLCFRVKVQIEQVIQDDGMLLQPRHQGGSLRLRLLCVTP